MKANANSYRAFLIRKRILQLVAENYIISASMVSHTLLLSYTTVLRHLNILKEEDLVEVYKDGRFLKAKFKANKEEIQKLYTEYTEYLNVKNNLVMRENESRRKIKTKSGAKTLRNEPE